MKLWYQSLTRESQWPEYNRVLRQVLRSVADPGTEIEVHGITKRGGIGDQYRYLEFVETIEVLENVERAQAAGFDGFLIGNIADPGLREAREIASFPVLGLCETSITVAAMMGVNYALVASNEKHKTKVMENIVRYRMEQRMLAFERMRIERLPDLDLAFKDERVRDHILGQFREAAEAASAAGAEVVIPAVGVAMALIAEAGIHEVGNGTPVLNGIVALVKMGEAAVRMNGIMGGRFCSRRATYAQPPGDQIEELREFYGPVYPQVSPTRR
jgi:allantoin racemase